jgi:hypothetical protein
MVAQLTFCIWDGDADERFTFNDMNRILSNLNTMGAEFDPPISVTGYAAVTRQSPFSINMANDIEEATYAMADALGVTPPRVRRQWTAGGPVSYVDFDRVEVNLWFVYKMMGGEGGRVPAGSVSY